MVTQLHCADLVVPVVAEPIPRGAVAVTDGTIAAVGSETDLTERFPQAEATHWTGVLTPGLVNAHAHLQYTSFADVGARPYETYTEWSIRFVEEYEKRINEDWTLSARNGAEQMVANGITAIADIVTNYECRDVLLDLAIPGVAYLELIGVDLENWAGGLGEELQSAVESAPTTPVNTVGISPHAPYSIDAPVLALMAELARDLSVRLHIHVAESDGEDELYRYGTGSLAERLKVVATQRVAALDDGGFGMGAGAFVQSLGVLGPTCHIAHGVYLAEEGRSIMTEEATFVALCPRSNHIVGVDYPPVADFLAEGTPIAVGTDSLSSSNSLDLLEDVALLRTLAVEGGYQEQDLDSRLLHVATLGGATALGLDSQLGSLEVGKRADLAVFDVGSVGELIASGAGTCLGTIIGGEIRYRALSAGTNGTSGYCGREATGTEGMS